MSADNIALQQRFLGAFAGGDTATLRAILHPGFAMEEPPGLPYSGTYQGPEGFLSFGQRFVEMLDIEELQPLEIFVAPSGSLIGELVIRATHKATGKKIDTTILEKWDFADGKVLRITPHYFNAAFG